MTVSILTAIHEKPVETWEKVLHGLDAQGADQLVIVHDRASQAIQALTDGLLCAIEGREPNGPSGNLVNLSGPPGWRSPCISFNAGLAAVTGDVVLLSHSDIVQAPGNVERVRAHFTEHPDSVLFGMVVESNPEQLTGDGNAGPVLCSSTNTRALTFLIAAPTAALRAIGGWDVAFQAGVCYEDDDLTARLWKHGLDFHFEDAFHGVHMTHSRAYFLPRQMAVNMALMLEKHGKLNAGALFQRDLAQGRAALEHAPNLTTWKHSKYPHLNP